MIPGSNTSVLQWFDDISKQHHNKWYAFGEKHPAIASLRRMPFWEITRTTTAGTAVDSITLVRMETGGVIHLIGGGGPGISELQTVTITAGVEDVVVYPGINQLIPTNLPTGQYYATFQDAGGLTLTSEVFCMVENLTDHLKISWWHEQNFEHENGFMVYPSGVKAFMYFRTDLGKPTYPIQRRVIEKGGHKLKVHQTRKKVFQFDVLATEGMADVLSLVGLHHHCEIEYMGDTYSVEDFIPTMTWEDRGDLCTVNCVVETGVVTRQTGSALITAEYDSSYNDDYT